MINFVTHILKSVIHCRNGLNPCIAEIKKASLSRQINKVVLVYTHTIMVYFLGTTMEIRVTIPFTVSFIPGDQYGGPDCSIIMLTCTVYSNKSNQNQNQLTDRHNTEEPRLCVWNAASA